jgi:hypothetical protein
VVPKRGRKKSMPSIDVACRLQVDVAKKRLLAYKHVVMAGKSEGPQRWAVTICEEFVADAFDDVERNGPCERHGCGGYVLRGIAIGYQDRVKYPRCLSVRWERYVEPKGY